MGGTTISQREAVSEALRFYSALGFKRLPMCLPDAAARSKADKGEVLERIVEDIGDCTRCKLHEGRSNIVFGEGNPRAELMFIGEGPGRDEDAQGRPFVGEAGQLLTRLIERMGFKREDVYIANIVKCRPPGNRDPEPDEIETCSAFLHRQIEVVAPKVIMPLGRIAAHALLGVSTPISRLRGKFSRIGNIDVMPTFHPAYLLRNPKDKMLVWGDAQQVLKKLGRPII